MKIVKVVILIWVEVEKLKKMGGKGGVGCCEGGVKKMVVVIDLRNF